MRMRMTTASATDTQLPPSAMNPLCSLDLAAQQVYIIHTAFDKKDEDEDDKAGSPD